MTRHRRSKKLVHATHVTDPMIEHLYITTGVSEGGEYRLCTICKTVLSTSEMGVNNHLLKHVRLGELAEKDKWKVRREIMSKLERA